MTDQKDDFKVVDKRASSGASDAPQKQGEKFTMSEPTNPQVDFSTLVLSLATGTLINLGLAPDPGTKKVQKNLEMAKHNIDILELLRDKTRGNLSAEENTLMENIMTEVRLRFVEAAR